MATLSPTSVKAREIIFNSSKIEIKGLSNGKYYDIVKIKEDSPKVGLTPKIEGFHGAHWCTFEQIYIYNCNREYKVISLYKSDKTGTLYADCSRDFEGVTFMKYFELPK